MRCFAKKIVGFINLRRYCGKILQLGCEAEADFSFPVGIRDLAFAVFGTGEDRKADPLTV